MGCQSVSQVKKPFTEIFLRGIIKVKGGERVYLPKTVETIIQRLEESGYSAYVVGGCVRDSLMGRVPHDFDICTNALPERVMQIFSDLTCVPTGLQHGTVTVVWEKEPFEITTYRTEGEYRDSRHPDRVSFVATIEEDLSRRDFTVNAMAYHPVRGLVDPFGGKEDLSRRVLRCVGDPEKRFTEDALRILRGLRFAACYGFSLEETTAAAIIKLAPRLHFVAAERIREELDRLLMGKYAGSVLLPYRSVFAEILPELKPTFDFEQHNPHHHLDVYGHTVQAVVSGEERLPVRLALLLHDIGKPRCFSRDEKGIGHFYGHASVSAAMAEDILNRLRYDRRTVERVCLLIRYHDGVILPEEPRIKRWLSRFGEEFLRQLLLVKAGDNLGQPPSLAAQRLKELSELHRIIDRVLEKEDCFSLRDLAINGNDLLDMGYTGKRIGEGLQWALEAVMDGRLENERDVLLNALRENT